MTDPEMIHVELPSGAIAKVSAKAKPETLAALDEMLRTAALSLGTEQEVLVIDQTRAAVMARKIVVDFMNEVDDGDGDFSCNQCELDTYLCPRLQARLEKHIISALAKDL